ncbi:hypothetical protein [Enterobacter ludwigii]|uniref:hypothetical protein n=1 Tax=Enterobacter ludwigii TaxID=299767 RepID=UPI00069B8896|nr:hypothetical protein [Enterobacter ludwigii]
MAKTDTVIIGCKLPHGLKFTFEDAIITLNGLNKTEIINGFGLTRDVPSAAWAWFEKTYKSSRFIANGLVFAVGDDASARSASAEREGNKSGLEQAPQKSKDIKPDKEEE